MKDCPLKWKINKQSHPIKRDPNNDTCKHLGWNQICMFGTKWTSSWDLSYTGR
jgi:hypothetical protein